MGVLSIQMDFPGQVGVNPRRGKMITTDSNATVIAAGYLNSMSLMGQTLYPTDLIDAVINYNPQTNSGDEVTYQVAISSGVITLSQELSEGNVIFPVVSGDFAVFSGTAGKIADLGYLPTNAAKTRVVMANGAVIANHIACYTDTSGTVDDDAGTAINGGNIQAGLSGTAGYFASFPGTASKGSLRLTAVANTGDTVTTISNAAMGQASVISIPDPAAATASFAVAPAALVNNNLVKASGTAGLVADAGVAVSAVQLSANIKAATTGNIGGAGAGPISVVVAGATAASVVVATVESSSNPVSVIAATATGTGFDITFSADPGASCLVNYVLFIAAQ